jgi:hypothetical protein
MFCASAPSASFQGGTGPYVWETFQIVSPVTHVKKTFKSKSPGNWNDENCKDDMEDTKSRKTGIHAKAKNSACWFPQRW